MRKLQIDLVPSGAVIQVEAGSRLRDILAPYDVEFACDGVSQCGSCRVQVLEGVLPITAQDSEVLRPCELADGWRLACQAVANSSLRLRCSPGDLAILSDSKDAQPSVRSGLGVAVDLGTTTIVAQLLDLSTGRLLGERSALNPQTRWGADIMTRIRSALSGVDLTSLIREFVGNMVADLASAHNHEVKEVVLVGNTVMHHLFCGIDLEPLCHLPFTSSRIGEQRFSAEQLNWAFADA